MHPILEGLLVAVVLAFLHEFIHAVVALARKNLQAIGIGVVKVADYSFSWQPVLLILVYRRDKIVAAAPLIVLPLAAAVLFGITSVEFLVTLVFNIAGGLGDLMLIAGKGLAKKKEIPFWGAIYWISKRKLVVGWQ